MSNLGSSPSGTAFTFFGGTMLTLLMIHGYVLSGLLAKDLFESCMLRDGPIDNSGKFLSRFLFTLGPIGLIVMLPVFFIP